MEPLDCHNTNASLSGVDQDAFPNQTRDVQLVSALALNTAFCIRQTFSVVGFTFLLSGFCEGSENAIFQKSRMKLAD